MANRVQEDFGKMKTWLGSTSVQTAADVDLIVTSVDMKVGSYTVAAQPTSPSLITVSVTATSTADTMGTITITGTDITNAVISETVVPVAGSTVSTTRAFKTVTTVVGAGWVAAAGADKITVGIPATGTVEVRGQNISFICLTGVVYINPSAVATATSASFMLTAGRGIPLVVSDNLSYISDGNAATIEFIIWG